jgi:hypothetical protein
MSLQSLLPISVLTHRAYLVQLFLDRLEQLASVHQH